MRLAIALCLGLLLAGCDNSPAPFASAKGAPFDPLAFFTGHVRSWGVIEDRDGAPTGVIRTDCRGTRAANGSLTLVQHLTEPGAQPGAKPGGKTRERDWTLLQTGPNTYEATANDMVGSAHGVVSGPSFHWIWVWARSPHNPLMNLTMDQWMYRLPDGSVMIRTTISKLGVIMAEVSEQFVHADADGTHRLSPRQNPS
jgi:hypothetical protein